MRDVTLKQLRIVSAIARTGRVVTAADALSVTPPAVTLQLKLLEDNLGLTLFERGRNGMALTAAGHRMIDAARRIDGVLRETEGEIGKLRALRRGSVSVGVVSTAKYFAPAALGAFRKLHPETEISLTVGNRAEIIAALASQAFDLVIMGRPPENLEIESVVMGEHPHVVIAAPEHRLARRSRMPMSVLADEPMLVREPESGTRILMHRLFQACEISPPIVMEMSSNETIKQAVMADLGVAFISAHTIAYEVESARLAVLDIIGLPARRQWQLVRPSTKPLTPVSTELWTFLAEQGRAFLPLIARHSRLVRPE